MISLIKNKFTILIISIIVVCIVYFGARKMIDNNVFNTDRDIVSEYENIDVDSKEEIKNEVKHKNEISKEETDFITEEVVDEINEEDNSERDDCSEWQNSENGITNNGESKERKIYVYITGEVNIPGVVILNEGSRIVDAINAAGGTTPKANISKVNLVYVLDDGMKVNIPNDDDLKNNSNFEYITKNSGDGRIEDYSNKNFQGTSSLRGESLDYSIVNINTATQTELETLPGIGPSLALKIINYRKENGKFSSIDEIKNVSGIGESKYETIKSLITV